MKKEMNFGGAEYFTFGQENKLRIFPPNTYKFKPKNDHIILDEVQECIMDNFWFQYNNKREDKGYMLSILNSLAEYFNTINEMSKPSKNTELPKKRPLYVIFDGKRPGIYITFEELVTLKLENHGELLWKKYANIDEALTQARIRCGMNYYIEPAAKELCNGIK